MPSPAAIIKAGYRQQWIEENGPCVSCGTWYDLEVDHIDRDTKAVKSTSHIWSMSKARREVELAKCQVLCVACHREKTNMELEDRVQHGTLHMYNSPRYKCRCEPCKEAYAAYQREYRRLKKLQA